jgi:peptide/nickel transport system substrate-binding protein
MNRDRTALPRDIAVVDRQFSRRSVLGAALFGAAAIPLSSLLAACSADSSATSSTGGRGGTLRVAAPGAGASETLNPGVMNSPAEIARAFQVYEPLFRLDSRGEGLENVLAEDLTPDAVGSVWTLTLRKGVTWHDGRPFTADDVIYTIRYHLENLDYPAPLFANIDAANLKKIDAVTLSIPLRQPNFLFPPSLADLNALIIQDGTTEFSHPVGTGPFKFQSFTPGQRASYVRNPDYWESGSPKLDGIQIVSIDDENARVNALLSAQVDAISAVPSTGAAQLESAGAVVLTNHSGAWGGLRMLTTKAPFNDVKVRQAMRLLVERDQVVANGLSGRGKTANDLFGWFDPVYAGQLGQHEYDPDQAKSLLRQAGQSGLSVTLESTPLTAGLTAMETLFAASAAAGGVTVNVQQQSVAQFYAVPNDNVLLRPTAWSARPISAQMSNVLLTNSTNNETRWSDPDFERAYAAAAATGDPGKQSDYLLDAQTIFHDRGGYVIPYFSDFVSGTSSRVSGARSNVRQEFGDWDFRGVTLS